MPNKPPKATNPWIEKAKKRAAEIRNAANAKIYDEDWRKLRAAFIKRHPFCAECGEEAKHVDHVIPVQTDKLKRLDWKNLRSLCISCHSKKTIFQNPIG